MPINSMFYNIQQARMATNVSRMTARSHHTLVSKVKTLQATRVLNMSRSQLSSKFSALKNTLYNYLYGSNITTQLINSDSTSSMIQKPTADMIDDNLSLARAATGAEPQGTTSKSIADLESVKVLLEMDGPNEIPLFNALSQISSHIPSSEIDFIKQKFFEKINFDNAAFVKWLKANDPVELYKLLPHDNEIFTQTIESFYQKILLYQRTDLRSTFWLGLYRDKLSSAINGKSLNDLSKIILTLMKSPPGTRLVEECIDVASFRRFSSPFKNFIQIIKQNKDFFLKSRDGFALIVRYVTGADFLEVVFDIDSSYGQVPSYQHLEKYHYMLSNLSDARPVLNDLNFQSNIIRKPIDKEKKLIAQGYVVMYHARRSQYGFLSDIYSMIYSYKSGKKLEDFVFTHLDDPVLDNVSERFYALEKDKRERLIKEGNLYNSKIYFLGAENRASLLFLNKFLFGNLSMLGSCSMDYVLNNHNMSEIDFPIQEVFSMFGSSDVYREFESKLKNLQEKYTNLTNYGELLQIAIPEENVDKCVYYTASGGPKKEFQLPSTVRDTKGSIIMHANGETTDIKIILKELDRDPEDKCEFALINTRDQFGGLNPESGIKIFSYNAVDDKKWAAFQAKKHLLFASITERMRQHEIQKEQAKIIQA